jgi:hypothetical protein
MATPNQQWVNQASSFIDVAGFHNTQRILIKFDVVVSIGTTVTVNGKWLQIEKKSQECLRHLIRHKSAKTADQNSQ